LDEAFKWDQRVLIEKFIPGREIRVAIIPKKVISNIDIDIRGPSKVAGKKSSAKV
jgi:D-alanine-D-alanine ligase-like ATP-grasp enzyme